MRIVVTGGAGFIGHHLVAALISRGDRVTVIDNLHRGSFERPELVGADLLRGNVLDDELCGQAFQGADCVVHLAAQSQVMTSEREPQLTFDDNVAGAWAAARSAVSAGVPHLVFASSREVYGNAATLPVPETAPIAPHNLYGASKAAAEMLLTRMPRLPLSILRLANVVGPGDAGRVVPRWIEAARKGMPLTVFGGTQVLDLVPVEVAVQAFVRVIERGPLIHPMNVGSGVQTPILELAQRILEFLGSSSTVVCGPPRDAEVDRYCADTGRMREVLGIEPPLDPVSSIGGWCHQA